MKTAFYFPGKLGDAIMQWPIAYWWRRETQKPIECWIDGGSCKPLVPLFEAQPGVEGVKIIAPSESYRCGGQPWQGPFTGEDHENHHIISLGFRGFPQRQLTLQTLHDVPLKLETDIQDIAETPSLVVPEEPKANRVLLHGTGICHHTKQTPKFWAFLASIRHELELEFEEIVFIGSEADVETGKLAYPNWSEFHDDGDLLKLASYMNASRLVLGCGSSMVALAGALKVPCVRVHDDIGGAPAVIWSNLGRNQLNATELELRTKWPQFREQWIHTEVPV